MTVMHMKAVLVFELLVIVIVGAASSWSSCPYEWPEPIPQGWSLTCINLTVPLDWMSSSSSSSGKQITLGISKLSPISTAPPPFHFVWMIAGGPGSPVYPFISDILNWISSSTSPLISQGLVAF